LGIAKAPNLSITQRQLPISRNISMLGAVFGVMIGCGLGASSLLLRDLEAHEEMPEDNNLASILDSIIQDNKIDADCCTIFLTDQNLAREISGDVKSFAVRVISEIETDTAVQKSLNDRAVVTDTIDVQTTHLVESLKFHSILCKHFVKNYDALLFIHLLKHCQIFDFIQVHQYILPIKK